MKVTVKVLLYVGYHFLLFSFVGKTTNMVLNEKENPIDVYTENFKATISRIHELVFLPLTTKIGIHE